jgi:hypothetical protein
MSDDLDPAQDDRVKDHLNTKQLVLFQYRCQEVAEKVNAGVMPFVDGVDLLYSAAVWSGLSESVGDDAVQKIMHDTFRGRRAW